MKYEIITNVYFSTFDFVLIQRKFFKRYQPCFFTCTFRLSLHQDFWATV